MKATINNQILKVEVIDANYNDHASEVKILEGKFTGKKTIIENKDLISSKIRTRFKRIACDQENSMSIEISATAKTEAEVSDFMNGFQTYLDNNDIDAQFELCPVIEEVKNGFRYSDCIIVNQESNNAQDDFKAMQDIFKQYKKEVK